MSDRSKIVEALARGFSGATFPSTKDYYRAQAALLAIEGGGWVVVPREPTGEMMDAGDSLAVPSEGYYPGAGPTWIAMVSTFLQQGGGEQGSSVAESGGTASPKSDGRLSAGRETPWRTVERLFGRRLMVLSVPGRKDGIQSISAEFQDGSSAHVAGKTIEEAWANLGVIASSSAFYPAEPSTGQPSAASTSARATDDQSLLNPDLEATNGRLA